MEILRITKAETRGVRQQSLARLMGRRMTAARIKPGGHVCFRWSRGGRSRELISLLRYSTSGSRILWRAHYARARVKSAGGEMVSQGAGKSLATGVKKNPRWQQYWDEQKMVRKHLWLRCTRTRAVQFGMPE